MPCHGTQPDLLICNCSNSWRQYNTTVTDVESFFQRSESTGGKSYLWVGERSRSHFADVVLTGLTSVECRPLSILPANMNCTLYTRVNIIKFNTGAAGSASDSCRTGSAALGRHNSGKCRHCQYRWTLQLLSVCRRWIQAGPFPCPGFRKSFLPV